MSQDKQRIPVKSEEQDLENVRFAAAMDRALQADNPKEEDIELINKTFEEHYEHPAYSLDEVNLPETDESEEAEDKQRYDQKVASIVNETEQTGLNGTFLPSLVADLYTEAVPQGERIDYPEGDLPVAKTPQHHLDELLRMREDKHGPREPTEPVGSFIKESRREGVEDEEIADDLLTYAAVSRAEMNYGDDPDQMASRLVMSRPDEALALYEAGRELEDGRIIQVAERLTEKFLDRTPDKYSTELEEMSLDDLEDLADGSPGEGFRNPDPEYFGPEAETAIDVYDRLENNVQMPQEQINTVGWAAARKAMGGA